MTFLCIGLGLAMVLDFSNDANRNNINNLTLLSNFKENQYFQSSLVMTEGLWIF